MKTKTLVVLFSFAALAATGSAIAGDAHDTYYQAFYGHSVSTAPEMTGKAAFGTPSGNVWSGHEAYQRAFVGGEASPATALEIQGKATFGTASGPDGHAIYSASFGGD